MRENINRAMLGTTLFALDKLLNALAAVSSGYKEEMSKHNITVQMKLRDNTFGQWFEFKNGVAKGKSGIYDADVEMIFETVDIANNVATVFRDQMEFVNAAKTGSLVLNGEDAAAMWFAGLLLKFFAADVLYYKNYGTRASS